MLSEESKKFNDELKQLLEEDSENDENNDNYCLITGNTLEINAVKLDCGHKFNYHAIFKDIVNQKFKSKTYNLHTSDETFKMKKSGTDYFIRCPYCRNSQTTLLEYYPEMGLEQIYGVNTNNKNYKSTNLTKIICSEPIIKYDKIFKYENGKHCDHNIINIKYGINKCSNLYVTNLTGTEQNYCENHYIKYYQKFLKDKKLKEEKQKKQEEKQKKQEEKQKKQEEKQKKQEDKQKKQEEKQKKQEDKQKKQEEKQKKQEDKIIYNVNKEINKCKAILKSGINKGKQCGCYSLLEFCGIHKKYLQNNNL
jgi:hypothetical protein